jgi:hypothetical protein
MRKLVYTFIKFLLFSVCAYMLFLFLWGYTGVYNVFRSNFSYKIGAYGHLYTRVREARETKDVDILVLGSSHAYRGFDPRYFRDSGYRIFNLGSSAQTPLQAEVLLGRYLDSLHPKNIILEVYHGSFASDGVESSLDIISNDKNDRLSLAMALRMNSLRTYNTLGYGLMNDVLGLHDGFIEKKVKGDDAYINGGYIEKKISFFRKMTYPPQNWEPNKKQFAAFERILVKIKQRNINVILVFAPVTKGFYNSFRNNGSFDSIMSSYGTYYNFNRVLQLDDSLHFHDPHHLNQKGVEIFNKKLLEILRSTGVTGYK